MTERMIEAGEGRVRRAPASREAPLRQATMSAVVDRTADFAGRVEGLLGGAIKTAQVVVEASTQPVLGAAERGVQTAYAVIEEYVARGREAARQYQQSTLGGPQMSDNRSQFGNGMGGAWGPMAATMTPMLGTWLSLAKMWSESMAPFVPGGSTVMNQMMSAWGVPGVGAGARPVNARHRVQVTSKQPATVTLQLDPDAEYMMLRVATLVSAKGGQGLTGATISCKNGVATVSLTVPETWPTGTFVGPITDEGGNRRGELQVEVSAAPAS